MRTYLQRSIRLRRQEEGAEQLRTFTILKSLGSSGSSALCYEAEYASSGRGVLKEFWPREFPDLTRNSEGQLELPQEPGQRFRFQKAQEAYQQPYHRLLALKKSDRHQDLSQFIPYFEIWQGSSGETGAGTAYIWTPAPRVEPFSSLCEAIHKKPEEKPQALLLTTLLAVKALTECVCQLHRAGLIHRDLTPGNWGFLCRNARRIPEAVSLFDINSICSYDLEEPDPVGTPGFREPEAISCAPSIQGDLYSMGCNLYEALISAGDPAGYRDENYDDLGALLSQSPLLKAREGNCHPKLMQILLRILQRCLAARSCRYQCCEELTADLDRAIYYAGPYTPEGETEQWVLSDMDRLQPLMDRDRDRNAMLAIQYHLMLHPLYEYRGPGNQLNVLVLGLGDCGQKFLDAVLQAGQLQAGDLRDLRLNVTVVSGSPEDRQLYLQSRPGLTDFFTIDGVEPTQAEVSYGSLFFETCTLDPEDPEVNQQILMDQYDRRRPGYVFAALGSNRLSRMAAQACRQVVDTLGLEECTISYAWDRREPPEDLPGVVPVLLWGDPEKLPGYADIERMAFNTHVLWEDNLNLNYRDVRRRYEKPYNHLSSLSCVTHIQYKLFCMGIRLDQLGFEEAAAQAKKKLAENAGSTGRKGSPGHPGIREELIWIEHRRWVAEKLTQGWTRLRDLEECAEGRQKSADKRGKRHICIVDSRPDLLLTNRSCGGDRTLWDTAEEGKLTGLDPLDRLSVDLHRMYCEKARALKADLLTDRSLSAIETLVRPDPLAASAFLEWRACLVSIFNRDREAADLYDSLKDGFLEAVKKMPTDRRQAICGHVKAFEALFTPVLDAVAYTDWKNKDAVIIDGMSFVLTYSGNGCLAVPFGLGSPTAIFDNVAAASAVSPSRIIFLVMLETREQIRSLLDAVPTVAAILERKHMKAAVDWVLLYREELVQVNEDLEQALRREGHGRFRSFKRIGAPNVEDGLPELMVYLRKRQKKWPFFALEKNDSGMSRLLQGSGFYSSFPAYEFRQADPRDQAYRWSFRDLGGCQSLTYLTAMPYLTAGDLAAFQQSTREKLEVPEFYADYESFWTRYCLSPGAWKHMCNALSDHAKTHDVLATFRRLSQMQKAPRITSLSYILPGACRKSAERIVQKLLEEGILEEGSSVRTHSSQTCQVLLADRSGYQDLYEKLFSRVYALMQEDAIDAVLRTGYHEVDVTFDNLRVTGLRLPPDQKEEILELLQFMRDRGYVLGLREMPNGICFTYSCRSIKQLLTVAGKLLEHYVYYKARSMGCFQDVLSSMEISWKDSAARNEFDCILTKGFRSLIVECKARPNLEPGFYYKLSMLAQQIGIHATPVLIADTQEKDFYDTAANNRVQRAQGRRLGVITVWKPEQIRDIGRTLRSIMNGTYEMEEE